MKSKKTNLNLDDSNEKKHKNEFILVAILAIIILISFVYVRRQQEKEAFTIDVSVDGITTATYSLDEEIDTWIDGYQGGRNHLIIHEKTVKIEEADCPDKLCVKQGAISKSGETVVCLPHRIVVTVK